MWKDPRDGWWRSTEKGDGLFPQQSSMLYLANFYYFSEFLACFYLIFSAMSHWKRTPFVSHCSDSMMNDKQVPREDPSHGNDLSWLEDILNSALETRCFKIFSRNIWIAALGCLPCTIDTNVSKHCCLEKTKTLFWADSFVTMTCHSNSFHFTWEDVVSLLSVSRKWKF